MVLRWLGRSGDASFFLRQINGSFICRSTRRRSKTRAKCRARRAQRRHWRRHGRQGQLVRRNGRRQSVCSAIRTQSKRWQRTTCTRKILWDQHAGVASNLSGADRNRYVNDICTREMPERKMPEVWRLDLLLKSGETGFMKLFLSSKSLKSVKFHFYLKSLLSVRQELVPCTA